MRLGDHLVLFGLVSANIKQHRRSPLVDAARSPPPSPTGTTATIVLGLEVFGSAPSVRIGFPERCKRHANFSGVQGFNDLGFEDLGFEDWF